MMYRKFNYFCIPILITIIILLLVLLYSLVRYEWEGKVEEESESLMVQIDRMVLCLYQLFVLFSCRLSKQYSHS